MSTVKKFTIKLVPVNGPTLASDTAREWSVGHMFRVLWSDLACFRTGSRIVEQDIHDQEQHNNCEFTLEFDTLTLFEHITKLAEDDYSWDEARKLLLTGSIKLAGS